ncbi:hypothetical protein [Streptomyces sp. G1]|uniref:hypothetical protein n=1 Tax=Streptomyces sp. G1 TaxID=361572 RepID=UPI00202EF56E|nr:hypothetical protein [Streptomyces sp. G1]MCM1970697.1 hypothetical protein [Streptomyces sp. G1]
MRDALSGCLIFLLLAGGIVLLGVFGYFWGDASWQWAARSWPGGAYGFAIALGLLIPCLLALCLLCLGKAEWRSWRQHLVRTLAMTALSIVSAAAFALGLLVASITIDDGRGRYGHETEPSWAFVTYPWLWAVGLLSSLVTVVAGVSAVALYFKVTRKPSAPAPLTREEPPRPPSP